MIGLQMLLRIQLLVLSISSVSAGYQARTMGNVLDLIITVFGSLNVPLKMLEFGNQEVHDASGYDRGFPHFIRYNYDSHGSFSAKPFFQHLGIDHTSIDINGKDGAIYFDVRNDIRELFGNQRFDVVTNLGFTEHVGEGDVEENLLINQYKVFSSLHNVGSVNSLYFHDLPMIGSHFQHGVAHYNTSFFRAMAARQKYEIIVLFVTDYGDDRTKTVAAGYTKTEDNSFMSFEEFSTLPGLESIFSDYRVIAVPLQFTGGSEVVQYNIVVDTETTTSTDAAISFCEKELEALNKLGSMTWETCVSGVSSIIDSKKIQNSIR